MKTRLILTLGLLGAVSAAASAQDTVATTVATFAERPFAWSSLTLDIIASGDAARGEQIATKQKCSKCHGEAGIAEEDATPSIAGQIPAYQFKQLLDYKVELRRNKDMKKATSKLGLQDMADLAAYFATLSPEPPEGTAKPPLLVTRGDLDRLLLPCNVCHGEKGEGLGFEVPAITGQKVEHFIETLTAFREGERQNDHYGRMRFIAGQLTDKEVTELAVYYGAPRSPDADDDDEEEEE